MSLAILRRRELNRQMKWKVMNAMVMLVLTYGCETWVTRIKRPRVQDPSHADESTEEDRGSVLEGLHHQ